MTTSSTNVPPDVDFSGKVRDRDPEPSWDAAAAMDRKGELDVLRSIPLILGHHGPLTHEQIHRHFIAAGGNRTENRIRTATHKLVVEGDVVKHDENGRTSRGGKSTRWKLA